MTTFGPYTLLRPLGKGGMAEVFLAKAISEGGFERLLAIKRLLPPFNVDELLVSMLADEARLSVWLTHPNVVQVLDFGRVDKTYYIAMEYVDGCDLCKMVRVKGRAQGRPLPLATALYVISEVADALDHAHRRVDSSGRHLHIIHRDVSPHNVLVSREGQVKLADFGLARASISVHKSHAGVIRGKFAYMPKEQAHGHDIDHRIDIFAAGATLYEALTGVRPYSAANLAQQLYQLEQPIPPPSTHVPDIPEAIDDLTMQALAPDAENRYQSAEDLATDLRHALATLSTPTQEAQQLAALVKNVFGPSPVQDIARYRPAGLEDIRTGHNSLIGDAIAQVRRTLSGAMERREPEDHDTIESTPEFSDADDSVPTTNRHADADELAPTNLLPSLGKRGGRHSESEKTAVERKKSKRARSIVRGTIADSDVFLPPGPRDAPTTAEFEAAETTLRPKEEAERAIASELKRRRERRPEELATERVQASAGPARRPLPASALIVAVLGSLGVGGVAGWLLHAASGSAPCPPRRKCPTVVPVATPVATPTPTLDAAAVRGTPVARTPDAHPPATEPTRPGARRPVRRRARPAPVVRSVKLDGALTVRANQPAVVYVDGKVVGQTPLLRHRLPAATYKIKIQYSSDGSYSSTRWANIRPNATTKLQYSR